jgi:hypothetical protein
VSRIGTLRAPTTRRPYFSKIHKLIAALPGPMHRWSPEAFREWRKRHKELIGPASALITSYVLTATAFAAC